MLTRNGTITYVAFPHLQANLRNYFCGTNKGVRSRDFEQMSAMSCSFSRYHRLLCMLRCTIYTIIAVDHFLFLISWSTCDFAGRSREFEVAISSECALCPRVSGLNVCGLSVASDSTSITSKYPQISSSMSIRILYESVTATKH